MRIDLTIGDWARLYHLKKYYIYRKPLTVAKFIGLIGVHQDDVGCVMVGFEVVDLDFLLTEDCRVKIFPSFMGG